MEINRVNQNTQNSKPKTTILYIGGFGRSGSTLLDKIYGEIDGFFSLGELRHSWQRCFVENQLSGDNKPFRESEFWQKVVDKAFGGFEQVPIEDILKLKTRLDRLRHVPRWMYKGIRPAPLQAALDQYGTILERFYGAIREVSGAKVLVDSSKHPSYAHLLAATERFDLRMLHMVRDSRACAHSWQRKVIRPEIHWKEEEIPRLSEFTCVWQWMGANALMAPFRKRLPEHYHVLRYEDLVRDPAATIHESLHGLGLGKPPLPFLDGTKATLGDNFTLAGNPFRFKKGDIQIRLDDEWKTKMPARSRRFVTLLTWPMLKHYGYL